MTLSNRWSMFLAMALLTLSVQAQQLKLFNEGIRSISDRQQLMVMDFMEHYFPRVMAKGAVAMQTQLADDKVFFRKGKPQDLYQVADTMPMTISFPGHGTGGSPTPIERSHLRLKCTHPKATFTRRHGREGGPLRIGKGTFPTGKP